MANRNTTIIAAVVVIVVIVIVAVAAWYVLSDDDDNDTSDQGGNSTGLKVSFEYNPDIRLAIFGNANGDDYLDQDDVKTIEAIIADNSVYDSEANCFADTNGDGYINEDDVELLNKIINKQSCTLYYWDATYSVASIDYPLSGKIASHHVYPLDACIILGLYDDVVGMTNRGFQNSIASDETRYPGSGTKIANIGTPEEDPEAMLMTGANVFLTPSTTDYSKLTDAYKAAGMDLQIVRLCMSQYETSCADLYGSILMLGVMFQREAEAHEYVDFVDSLLDYIYTTQAGLDELTFITPYDVTETQMDLDSSLPNGDMMGDVYTISKLPMTSVNYIDANTECPTVTMEWVLTVNPDVIVIITFHNYTYSPEYHQQELNEQAEYFRGTTAYETGRIYSVNYYNIANYGGIPQLALLAYYIWPDIFDEQVGWDYLQYYYDHWTEYPDPDVTSMGNAIPYKWEKP